MHFRFDGLKMIMVNHEKKIIFIATPKCASTSVKTMFLDYTDNGYRELKKDGYEVSRHLRAKSWNLPKNELKKNNFKKYLKIQFYRNPYERAVSCYFHCIHQGSVNFKNFEEFLKLKIKNKINCSTCNGHSFPQFQTKKINKLVNIKRMVEEIENINKKYKINIKAVTADKHSYRKKGYNYKDYLTPENKTLIKKAFKEDFKLNKIFL